MLRRITCLVLALMLALSLAACGSTAAPDQTTVQTDAAGGTGVEDGVLSIAMECAYAPYNWVQNDDSNGAVPIDNVPGSYANGYDVMIAKKICEANGWELKVSQSDWDSLVPGVQSGMFDAVIAGQSMTAERRRTAPLPLPLPLRTCPAASAPLRSPPFGMTSACPRSRAPRSSPPPKPLLPCSWPWKPVPWTLSAPICPPPRALWRPTRI